MAVNFSIKSLLTLCLAVTALGAKAQKKYPQNYFRNPLGIPISLAGNFGECRPNHFHSGIDIKTEGKENYAVYAAAEGYISRIKMEPGGFGHALYITHPNGYTTLYAHLNDFMPAVQQYLQRHQYTTQKWTADITLPATQFPVNKGEQIAWSGNTGSSSAPHLHFEIRDTKSEHPLNPQLFGFDITDNIAPKPLKLFVYNGDRSIAMQQAQAFALIQKGNTYSPAQDTIYTDGSVAGLGIHLYDYMDGSTNTLAYYSMEWYAQDQLHGRIILDDIGYNVTRYLYAYCDHAIMQRSGEWPILLFTQPGNALTHLYTALNDLKGKISLTNRAIPITILVRDVYGNESKVSFFIAKGTGNKQTTCKAGIAQNAWTYTTPHLKTILPQGTFYDSVCFTHRMSAVAAAYSKKHHIMDRSVAAHYYFQLLLKADKPVPFNERGKLAMMYDDGKKQSGKAATFTDGWYETKQRGFGSYWLVMDKKAPIITSLTPNNSTLKAGMMLRFKVKEETTSVAACNVYVGKQWLCFEQRGDEWIYKIEEHLPKGKQQMKVVAQDDNGNQSTFTLSYTYL